MSIVSRALAIAAMLLASPVLAAGLSTSVTPQLGGGISKGFDGGISTASLVVSYTGPGDVVAGATAFYGLRGYSKATSPHQAITIRRTSDSATSTINTLANGKFDTATATAFCAATTCFVTTIFDQIGTKNLAQGTTAAQPQLTFNCLNTTLPCLTFVGSSSQQLTGAFTASAQPVTASYVAERNGTVTANNSVVGSANAVQMGFGTTANLAFEFAGTVVTVAAPDNAFHAVQAVVNGASSTLNVDGALSGSLNAGAGVVSASVAIGSSGSSSNFLTGLFAEAVLFNGQAMTAPNQALLCHNQRIYYGTGGAC